MKNKIIPYRFLEHLTWFMLSVMLVFSIMMHFCDGINSSRIELLILFILIFPIVYFTIREFLKSMPTPVEGLLPRKILLAGIFALCLGVLFYYILPVQPTQSILKHQLSIETVPTRNPASKGAQIWIKRIYQDKDGAAIDLTQLRQPGIWEIDNAMVVDFDSTIPARIALEFYSDSDIAIDFNALPEGGTVKVTWDGKTSQVDLYNSYARARTVLLPYQSPSAAIDFTIMLLRLVDIGIFCCTFFVFFLLVIRRNAPEVTSQTVVRISDWILFALPGILIWTTFLLIYYPAVMSHDSVNQWNQIVRGEYSDYHPIFHTLLLWLLSGMGRTPTPVVIVQILLLSITAGWIFAFSVKCGIPRWVMWIIAVLFAILPFNAFSVVNIWKDVLYSTFLVLLTIVCLKVYLSDGEWINHGRWFILGLLAAFTALVRHNGLAAAFGTIFVMGVIYRSYWKKYLYALLMAIVLWLFVRGPVSTLIGVKSENEMEMKTYEIADLLHLVVAHVSHGTPLEEDEREYLASIHPLEDRWDFYTCSNQSYLYDDRNLNWDKILNRRTRIVELALSLSLRAPLTSFSHYLCLSQVIWRINSRWDLETFNAWVWSPQNYIDVFYILDSTRPAPVLPHLNLVAYDYLRNSEQGIWLTLLWRPALYLFLFCIGMIVVLLRSSDWKISLLAAPLILQTVGISFFTPGQSTRYQYPAYLICFTFFALLYFSDFWKAKKA